MNTHSSARTEPQRDARKRIRAHRQAIGLTQAEAADILGIGRLVYHRMESGARRLRYKDFCAISKAFGIPLQDLTGLPIPLDLAGQPFQTQDNGH